MNRPKLKHLLLLLVPLATLLYAQQDVDRMTPPPVDALVDFIDENPGPGGGQAGDDSSGESALDQKIPCQDIPDPETRSICWQALRARLQYYETGLTQRGRVFAWQHFSTQVIFFVVLGLVLIGVVLAWMQFRLDLKKPATGGRAAAAGAAGKPGHEVEISAQGIKVSSPVLGVVILALSLGFFYLYLVYVYPITELF